MEKILAEIAEIKGKYLRALQKVIIKSHNYMAHFDGSKWNICDTRIIDPSDYEIGYNELELFSYIDINDNCQHFYIDFYDNNEKDKLLKLEFFDDKESAELFIEIKNIE